MRTAPLIIGGGPAGAAAAITLAAAGVRAVVLERSRTPADALCGGFLSWRSLAALERLGIDSDTLNRERIDRVRLFAGDAVREAPLPRPALAVSRRLLDATLLARVAAVERGVTVRVVDENGVRLADGATIVPPVLFLASGKHDIRGSARPAAARGQDPTLGLRVRLPASPHLDRLVGSAVELHLFDRGYAGIARQEDGSVNLCLAVHRSRLDDAGTPAELLALLGARHPRLGERLGHMPRGGAIDAVANIPYGWRTADTRPGLFRLGDQAAVIPSLAGEGMGIALAGGCAAAATFLSDGAVGAARWQARFAGRIARPMRIAGWARQLAEGRAAAWLTRIAPAMLIQVIAGATRIPHMPVEHP